MDFSKDYGDFLIREAIHIIEMGGLITIWDPQYVWLEQARAYVADKEKSAANIVAICDQVNAAMRAWKAERPCAEILINKGSDPVNYNDMWVDVHQLPTGGDVKKSAPLPYRGGWTINIPQAQETAEPKKRQNVDDILYSPVTTT